MLIVKRLDADAIASGKQGSSTIIPDGKCKHANEALNAVLAPLFVRVQNDLGISSGPEPMPCSFEGPAQGFEIVDFAVEYDPTRAIFVLERLVSRRRQIDDRQTPKQQRHVTSLVDKRPGIVWTPVDKRIPC